jgi:hypothetical protein
MKPRGTFEMGRVIAAMLYLSLLLAAPAMADTAAANVTKLEGGAFAASTGGATRRLGVNDRLFEGDKVITGKDTSAELTFTDGTLLTLGASTIIRVDSYKYRKKGDAPNADAEDGIFSTSILKGVVRAVTGLLAKRRPFSVKFKTKVATIGIRGTHFAAEVDGDSATIILLAQQDTSASNAIEVSNAYGKVEIDKAGWGTEIPDATSPPSPPRKMRSTQSMNRILRSVQTTRRVRIPRSPIR